MPLKRRVEKVRSSNVTARAQEIWASGRKEMICLHEGGAGLICDPELAEELGLPELIMLPNMIALVDELSQQSEWKENDD
jgi:hypothetical protein